ncbi:acetyltransferase [Bacillus sp. JCM 19046]|nr:acetyltransferase [Bacillus sp. JCM 19045]GAF17316.1 acetyltransferase [Bacillus sp. JCM 19046]
MIHVVTALSPYKDQLANLLFACVNEGASVNFIHPMTIEKAQTYWNEVTPSEFHLVIIAKEKEVIQGTVQLVFSQKENGLHRAEIVKLLVAPTARRLGVGRRLMEAAEEEAVKAGRYLLVLDTEEGSAANSLYQSLHYQLAGTIPKFARSALSGELTGTTYYYKWLGE